MGAEDVRDGEEEKEEEGDGEEWRDPSIAAWEEAAAAVSPAVSSEPGARPRAQHAEPWTESLAPSLRDAIDALDWSQTHAALIPNAWNRVRLATFAETWAVFGVWPPADSEEKARTGKRRVVLEAYGDGGIHRALTRLRPDDVQYLAMRVSTERGGEPRFIAAAWLGPTSQAFIPDDDEDDDEPTTRGDDPEGVPADANPRARWRREWAAVRHYLAGAHAYVAVDGREFAAGDASGGGGGGGGGDGDAEAATAATAAASSPSSFDFAAALRHVHRDGAGETTHYDYDAPGDAERNAAGEGVDALAAALATLRGDDDDGEGSNHREGSDREAEGSSDLGSVDLGSVDAAVDARGEALASLRAELAVHARALHRAAWAADAERARASHDRCRAETLRATESMGAAKSEALRRRLATRAADREAGERVG